MNIQPYYVVSFTLNHSISLAIEELCDGREQIMIQIICWLQPKHKE